MLQCKYQTPYTQMDTEHSDRILIESQLSWSQRVEYSIHTSNQASDWSGSPDYTYKCTAYETTAGDLISDGSFTLSDRESENFI